MTVRTILKAPTRALCFVVLAVGQSDPGIAQATSAERLPGGVGQEWRQHLTDWTRAPDELPKVAESMSALKAARPLFISSAFGLRNDPFHGGSRRHDGIDLPGRLGTNVFATGPGVVTFAGWAKGYGYLVQLDHPGGLRTRYGHLSRILVSQGTTVSRGEILGLMGSTGRSTGSHLHYEVRVGGVPVNPLDFIGGGSVPRYDVTWPKPPKVTPRWTGWSSVGDSAILPEATIR